MKCEACKGKGKILLLVSHVDCEDCGGTGSVGATVVSGDCVIGATNVAPSNFIGTWPNHMPTVITSPPYNMSAPVQCQHTGCLDLATDVADPMSTHPINFCAKHYQTWVWQQVAKKICP